MEPLDNAEVVIEVTVGQDRHPSEGVVSDVVRADGLGAEVTLDRIGDGAVSDGSGEAAGASDDEDASDPAA
ncbi:MAG TPA: hypothetical protein VII16_16530, partial [Actinomycetes bacterium]